MITLILQDPSSKVIKGIQYLSTEGDLISYHLNVNRDEYIEAHVIFKDFRAFRYIVGLLAEDECFKNKC